MSVPQYINQTFHLSGRCLSSYGVTPIKFPFEQNLFMDSSDIGCVICVPKSFLFIFGTTVQGLMRYCGSSHPGCVRELSKESNSSLNAVAPAASLPPYMLYMLYGMKVTGVSLWIIFFHLNSN